MRIATLVVGMGTLLLTACGTSSLSDKTSSNLIAVGDKTDTTSRLSKTTNVAAAKQLRAAAHQASTANNSGSEGYKIGPQDVLRVNVFNVPELSREVAVAESGTINFPLIGETLVAGQTARDLEVSMARSLGAKYLQNPQVTVAITRHNSQRVTIEGAVKKPGIYPLLGKMSLLQLVATAEGFTDTSDDNVIIFRESNGNRLAARFNIETVRNGTNPDPVLQPGDMVIANASASKKLFNNILKAVPVAGLFALL